MPAGQYMGNMPIVIQFSPPAKHCVRHKLSKKDLTLASYQAVVLAVRSPAEHSPCDPLHFTLSDSSLNAIPPLVYVCLELHTELYAWVLCWRQRPPQSFLVASVLHTVA